MTSPHGHSDAVGYTSQLNKYVFSKTSMVRKLKHEVRDTPRCTCHRIPVASCKLFGDEPSTQVRYPETTTVAQNNGHPSLITHARSGLRVLRKIKDARRASSWISAITCRPQARVRIHPRALTISQQIFPAWRKHLHHIRLRLHWQLPRSALAAAKVCLGICQGLPWSILATAKVDLGNRQDLL